MLTLFTLTLIHLVLSNTNVVEIVQRHDRQTTMSCPLPPDNSSWSVCKFHHLDGSEGECAVTPDEDHQNCGSFGSSFIHITDDGWCQLVLESVGDGHAGSWSCQVTLDQSRTDESRYFNMVLLTVPSHTDFRPGTGVTVNFSEDQWLETEITAFNINPQPLVEWTMNNR